MKLPKRKWGGRNTLAAYSVLCGFSVPSKYGQDTAAKGIRAMRSTLAQERDVPSETARKAWKALLGHNFLDCENAFYVLCNAAAELEEAGYWG